MYYCAIRKSTEEQVMYTYIIQHQDKKEVNQELILGEAMVHVLRQLPLLSLAKLYSS